MNEEFDVFAQSMNVQTAPQGGGSGGNGGGRPGGGGSGQA